MTRVESYPDGAGPGGTCGELDAGGAGGTGGGVWPGAPAVLMTRVTPSAGLCDCATSVPCGPAPGVEVNGVVVPGVDCTGSVVSPEPVSSSA